MHGNHVHELHVDEPNTVLLPFRSDWKALALSPDGRWLAMWSETNNHIQVMAMQNPRAADGPVKTIPAGKHFAFTPDSRFLLTGLAKRNQLWSTATWAVTASFDGLALYGEENAPVAFGRLGTAGTILFAIADETGVIRLYEMTGSSGLRTAPAFRLLARLEGPDRKRVSSLTFNPQGSRLAVATAVQTVQVWDLAGVRRGLADLGLADSLPGFLASEAAPLTITFDPMETRASDPGWSRVCNVTFDLVDAARANPADRAKHFVERGKIYLKLKRLDLARVDFEEARRLKPQDAEIPKLLDRVRREGSSQPDTP
jgi:WD40 repeat protein